MIWIPILIYKKWFHFFSSNLLFMSLGFLFYQIYFDEVFMLEMKLGKSSAFSTNMVFLFDCTTWCFLTMVSSVSFFVLKYSYWYMPFSAKTNSFFLTFFLFIFSMILLASSSSLIWVILSWDGLGMSSFCLVMFFSNWKSYNSALITFLINRFGDFFFLLSIWSFLTFFSSNDLLFMSLGFFLTLTAMTKSAQVPFSAWLPAAMAAPTPVSSLVHSSTLVTAGIFLLIRFNFFLCSSSLSILYCLSIVTTLLSGLSALAEMDLKKIIALSTLSHLGFMMFFLSKGLLILTIVHLINHAFFKSLLFMVAGVMIHLNSNSQDVRLMSNINSHLSLLITFSLLANMGVPFLSGFYSKETLVLSFAAGESSMTLADFFFLFLSISLTCMYSVRIVVQLHDKKMSHGVKESQNSLWSSELKWLYFSSLFSCFSGGLLIWMLVDPWNLSEMSFFSKCLSLSIFFLMILMSYISVYCGFPRFFIYYGSKMWFIFDMSKVFSEKTFKTGKFIFWEIDAKNLLANTANLTNLFLMKKHFLYRPKTAFILTILMLLNWFFLN